MAQATNFPMISLDEITLRGLAPEPVERRPIILIVDDEVIIANTLAAILAQNGILAMTAYDGQGALSIAQLIPPDLLLTDVVMPDMSGIDLAMAMKQSMPHCIILLFSGQAATTDLLASARKDGYDFSVIAKPVHPAELLRRISEDLQTSSPKHSNDLLQNASTVG